MRIADLEHPLAIAMWDFSWLERRAPGEGYDDWDRSLDELVERGYDAVRIDAYPHLIAVDGEREFEVLPIYSQSPWGASEPRSVQILPALTEFMRACADRGVKVALSTWFREDRDDVRMRLSTPAALAQAWKATLDVVSAAGLLDSVIYVDLGNEFPSPYYFPFVFPEGKKAPGGSRRTPEMRRWANESIAEVRESYPMLDYCFSFCSELSDPEGVEDVSQYDLLDLHIWMALPEVSDFYKVIGYDLSEMENEAPQYAILASSAESTYRSDEPRWKGALKETIDAAAEWSVRSGKPLCTTESWALVLWMDLPELDWGWVKDLCAYGVETSVATGRWALNCTSNFCSPQHPGMWNDVAWHQRLTSAIHAGELPPVLTRR